MAGEHIVTGTGNVYWAEMWEHCRPVCPTAAAALLAN